MRFLAGVVALAAVLAVGVAQAEPDRVAAQRLKDLGAQAMGRNDFTLALEYFNSAYKAYPSAKLLYNIGLALDGAGRLPEAIDAYRRFGSEAGNDAPPEALRYAQSRSDELDQRVGTLLVERKPADMQVTLDDPVHTLPG